ncbi:hypothetical protein C0991_006618 [Blastosporella zonata]|nr:hypothetical protein C0991_006618 [Blastosporella zonata]
MTSARSAGPAWSYVVIAGSAHFQRFWGTGVTFDDANQISAATFINPTFSYDSSGQAFNVHYGTDPILSFHLGMAASFPLSAQRCLSASKLVEMAKQQFQEWCEAFNERINLKSPNVIIRMFAGDALAFARALSICTTTNSIDTGMFPSSWEAVPIRLDGGGYSGNQKNRAPIKFNIIDTSNLTDHLGLVNILVVTIPLLQKHPAATLFTNTLLSPSEVGGGFARRACSDITTLSLILGIIPVSYVSGFATQTNAHEIRDELDERPRQETISWKVAPIGGVLEPLQIGAEALGNILFNIYLQMFSDENISRVFGLKLKIGFVHYVRASFATLLALIKQRIRCDWTRAFHHMISLIERDKTLLTGSNHYQDLCCQLCIHGVGTVGAIMDQNYGNLECRIFRDWDHIPPVVCVVMKVPRKHLAELERFDPDTLGTPILHCEIENESHHNFFSAIQFFFGRAVPSYLDPRRLLAEEDSTLWDGTSPLIVSFYVPSWMLTIQTPGTQVRLSIRPGSTKTSKIYSVLGPYLHFFSASLLDQNHVQIAYERPGNPQELFKLRGPVSIKTSSPSQLVTMITGKEPVNATGLTGRVTFDDAGLQAAFRACSLADISVAQTSPFTMLVSIGQTHKKTILFPYPIDGSNPKTRIARASSYIEVDVRLRGSDFNGLLKNPFPVVYQNSVLTPWNVHHINLAKSPELDMSCLEWLPSHLSITLSEAEYVSKKNLPRLERGLISNVKCTIDEMFSTAYEFHNCQQVFTLRDSPDRGILIVLNCLRLDLASHTLVADACVERLEWSCSRPPPANCVPGGNFSPSWLSDAETGLILPPANSAARVSQMTRT